MVEDEMRDCIETIVKTAEELEGCIEQGNYRRALQEWDGALRDVDYTTYKQAISKLHSGSDFCRGVDGLEDYLRANSHSVSIPEENILMNLLEIRAYGAQTRLRGSGSHR